GDDPSRAAHRAAGDRRIQGRVCGADGSRPADAAPAGIVLTVTFECGGLAGSRGGVAVEQKSVAGSGPAAAVGRGGDVEHFLQPVLDVFTDRVADEIVRP